MTETATRLFVLGSFVNACCAEVERLPRPGESLRASRFTSEPGGKGFNVAIGARRLGAEVDCLVAIGDDAFGRIAEAAFAAAGISTDLVRRYAVPTGAGVGLIRADGETIVAVYPGANSSLCAEDVRAAAAHVARAAVVTAQFEITDPPILEAFEIARHAGGTTLLNPSPFRLPPVALLAATSVLVVNEREAADLAAALGLTEGLIGPDLGSRLADAVHVRGPDMLVVTLGAAGAVAWVRGESEPLRQPAFAVEAVDSLGAGDAFVAALAVGLGEGRPLAECLRRAAAAGAIVATRAGVHIGLPSRAEIDVLAPSESASPLRTL